MSKQASDLLGTEENKTTKAPVERKSKSILEAEAKVKAEMEIDAKAKIGKPVLFYKLPDMDGNELIVIPATILGKKYPGVCELQLSRGTFVEKITKVTYSEKPSPGCWSEIE